MCSTFPATTANKPVTAPVGGLFNATPPSIGGLPGAAKADEK